MIIRRRLEAQMLVDFCWVSGLVSIVLQDWEGSRCAIKRMRAVD